MPISATFAALLVGLAAPLAAGEAAPPSTPEHFGSSVPSHVLLILDVAAGETVRVDDPAGADSTEFPLGTFDRVVRATAALEARSLDPEATVPCDERCWTGGTHGDTTLGAALGWGCDTYFADLEATRAAADRLGFATADRASPREVAEFWRALTRASLDVSPATLRSLLAAGGSAVSSVRGSANVLARPRRSARALTGESDAGSWVSGVIQVGPARRWAFALFVPGAPAHLAAARADRLVTETLLVVRRSTYERGGEPWRLNDD